MLCILVISSKGEDSMRFINFLIMWLSGSRKGLCSMESATCGNENHDQITHIKSKEAIMEIFRNTGWILVVYKLNCYLVARHDMSLMFRTERLVCIGRNEAGKGKSFSLVVWHRTNYYSQRKSSMLQDATKGFRKQWTGSGCGSRGRPSRTRKWSFGFHTRLAISFWRQALFHALVQK